MHTNVDDMRMCVEAVEINTIVYPVLYVFILSTFKKYYQQEMVENVFASIPSVSIHIFEI